MLLQPLNPRNLAKVLIPNRDFMNLKLWREQEAGKLQHVSIPNRDFMNLKPQAFWQRTPPLGFQSLIGIL